MVICLERGADLHMAQLMPLPVTVSCFTKIHIRFTFLVPAHLGSPEKRAIKRVCVCVCLTTTSFVPSISIQYCNAAAHVFLWGTGPAWSNSEKLTGKPKQKCRRSFLSVFLSIILPALLFSKPTFGICKEGLLHAVSHSVV